MDLDAGTLQVRRAVQRFGGDAAARRPLLAERKRLAADSGEAKAAADAASARRNCGPSCQSVRAALREGQDEHPCHRAEVGAQPPNDRLAGRRGHGAAVAIGFASSRRGSRPADAGRTRGFVFTSSIGTPIEPRNVTRAFKALLKAAKLPDIRLHDLRHSCATLLLAQGVNPRVVMETLGHSQVSLTLNTYSHVLPALQQDAAAKMNAILGSR